MQRIMDHVTKPEHHLTAADSAFLRQHAGVREATPEELAELAARTAALDDFELTHAVSLPAVATLLGVSEAGVLAMTAAGLLYAHELVGDGHPRWPDWQFADGGPLPHLVTVVAAIPAGSHPTGIRTVMTSPSPDLVATASPGTPLSPADWLSSGGPATPVLVLLAAVAGAI